MNDFNNLYLIFIITGVILFLYKSAKPKKEHFLGPIVGPLKSVAAMANELPGLIGIIAEAVVNFFLNFIDMFIALYNAMAWVKNLPFNVIDSASYIATAFSDILLLMSLWLNPITMIKSIVRLIFFLVKLIFNTLFGIIKTLGSHFGDKLLDGIRGSLWGIPHGPDQHIEHSQVGGTGNISRTDLGIHGHHHAGSLSDGNVSIDREGNESINTDGMGESASISDLGESGKSIGKSMGSSVVTAGEQLGKLGNAFGSRHTYDDGTNRLYQPMRCYRGIGANGYINVVAMIICPPLGVFMSYGLKGILKILICAGLTLLYYFPGLIYGLLITTHLGLGRDIKMSDCGGEFAGIVITGCPKRKSKEACEEADIPNKLDKDGEPIKACIWDPDPDAKYGGVCRNSHIRYEDYAKYKSTTTNFKYTNSGPTKERVTLYENKTFDTQEQIDEHRYDQNANRTKESNYYGMIKGIRNPRDEPRTKDKFRRFNKERKDSLGDTTSKFDYKYKDGKNGSNFNDTLNKEEKIRIANPQSRSRVGENAKTFNVPDRQE